MSQARSTQNSLLLSNLLAFYEKPEHIDKMLSIINGESEISLRIVDWFATNYSKKNFVVVHIRGRRVNVYTDYKLNLRAYSKKRFDPFCRWQRLSVPYKEGTCIQTTIGQLNFFKWAIEKGVVDYISEHRAEIEQDMNSRNSTSRRREKKNENSGTRKKREELSISAAKSIRRDDVQVTITFS